MKSIVKIVLVTIAGLMTFAAAADSPRERLLLDSGWKFHLGDLDFQENIINAGVNHGPAAVQFNDSNWRTVNLPHDWAVELPFDRNAAGGHGYKPVGPGFPSNSIAWYRREFTLPASDKGKRLWLEFGGVYRNCRVFLNGYFLEQHASGYNSFRCDITDTANYGGDNVVAVRVDASQDEGWFYEGAGIYRHVWLVKTSPLAIAPDGVFVYSSFPNNIPEGPATIHLQTSLSNWQTNAAEATVTWRILDPDGNTVATADATAVLDAGGNTQVEQTATVASPILWSPESPDLYKLVTTVERSSAGIQPDGGQDAPRTLADSEEMNFGIRTLAWDGNQGFFLNGKHYPIRGVCNHQDAAGVGAAVPDALWSFRIPRLKEMGCNAIRTSHNERAAAFLDACDRLGMLVLDETRYFGSNPQSLANLNQQVCRDRNHPGVFLWSLANEEPLHHSHADEAIATSMKNLVHKLDPMRLCTAAVYDWPTGELSGISAGIDVQGFNYFNQGDTGAFHKNHPEKPSIGTEEGMAQYSRGIYENTGTYLSAYDIQKPDCRRNTAEGSIQFYAARPWIAGMFFWTGFDYRGEPSPFGWPNICSDFGILDTCGFPKDVFYYLQSCWTDKPMVHLLPHWNWSNKAGQNIDVWAFSNCKAVELFLNGRSLGKQEMPPLSHLQWKVKYEPGALSARGYDADGNVIAKTKLETTGAPAGIQLTPEWPRRLAADGDGGVAATTVRADGQDCSVVKVAITDAGGRIVPVASNLVHFAISGPGKIIGVGNGDAICHEPDVYFSAPDVRTVALDDWRMTTVPDLKDRPEVAESYDDSQWRHASVRGDTGPLRSGEMAVFRTRVQVTPKDLAVQRAKLDFGMIDDEGWVYVNGQLAGESHDWTESPSFDIRKYLHAGDNTIAVGVKNDAGAGGVNKGASLAFEKPPVPADWHRSAFNGLAQVIVQAGMEAGDIQLKASADGLAPATIIIHAEANRGPMLSN